MKSNKRKIIDWSIIIASIILVAGLGSLFVSLGMDFFNNLKTPSQFIPNFIIPIVWSVIYIIFAILLCLYTNKNNLSKKTIILLIINGIFNILWCLIFFTLNQTFLGLVIIIILAILSFLLVFDLKNISNLYYYITLIYPTWVSIATFLNSALWILN